MFKKTKLFVQDSLQFYFFLVQIIANFLRSLFPVPFYLGSLTIVYYFQKKDPCVGFIFGNYEFTVPCTPRFAVE